MNAHKMLRNALLQTTANKRQTGLSLAFGKTVRLDGAHSDARQNTAPGGRLSLALSK